MGSTTSVALILSVCLIPAACGGSDDDATSFCERRSELSASIDELRDHSVREDGIDAVDAQLDAVLADADALSASASELQPDVDAVRASIDGTLTSVRAATSLTEQATALVAGLDQITTSWNALDDAARSECD